MFLVLLVVATLLVANGFTISRFISGSSSRRATADNNIERELDLFFEKAAEQGSPAVTEMSLRDRVARVRRGEELENTIFSKRDEILALENSMLSGYQDMDTSKLEEMRAAFTELKAEYLKVVGGQAKDVPIYFGRVPDSLQ